MNLQVVIDESRPMLTEFLQAVGLLREGDNLDLSVLLEPFSEWVAAQSVDAEDRFYLSSRLGAYICEFLIDHHSAERHIEGRRILIRMPIAESVAREFDPYAVALGIADGEGTLAEFLHVLTSSTDTSV